MKKGRKSFLILHHNFSELDRLVLDELNAIRNEALKELPRQCKNYEKDKYEKDIYYDDICTREELSKKRQIHPKKINQEEMEHFNHEFEIGFDDSYLPERKRKKRQFEYEERIWEEPYNSSQELDIDYTDESKELLNEEEEKFVHDVVKWLSSRENKDVIISKIWSLLTESDPESFYDPEAKKIQAQAEVSDLSEDNPKSEEGSSKSIQDQSEPSDSSDSKTKSERELTEQN